MRTIQDIMEELETLNTPEGILAFIEQRTFLPHDRLARIYEYGKPWPFGNFPELDCLRAIHEGATTIEGVAPETALNAYAELRQLDIDLQDPDHKDVALIRDHTAEVARLSGEDFDTVSEVYGAEIKRWQALLNLFTQAVKLRQTSH